jgi:hypothetical protein
MQAQSASRTSLTCAANVPLSYCKCAIHKQTLTFQIKVHAICDRALVMIQKLKKTCACKLTWPCSTKADMVMTCAGEEIYFFGIIDFLQEYTSKKRTQTFYWSLFHSKKAISCVRTKPCLEHTCSFFFSFGPLGTLSVSVCFVCSHAFQVYNVLSSI